MNEENKVVTMDTEEVTVLLQEMQKQSKWLSAFLENYSPPLDGERYLTALPLLPFFHSRRV